MEKHHLYDKWSTFEWKRPAQVYGEGEFSLFNQINVDDIKQGYWGDCYFLSAICALAEYPERIKELFETKELNSPGIYSVIFYISGEKKSVTVDDYFPFYPKKQNWAFTQCIGKEIWVMILEKAWAKIHGSYQRIEGGNTAEALYALSGSYIDYIFHDQVKNKTALWTRILEADKSEYAIATSASSTRVGKHSDQMKAAGIVDAHAYALIGVDKIETDQNKEVKLVKLRNPWGFEEWKGAWSDNDDKNWTPELKKKLKYQSKEDGIFYMDFEDYIDFYYTTSVCKYQKTEKFYHYSDVDTVKDFGAFEFKVKKGGDKLKLFLAVTQINSRFKEKKEYEYAPVQVMVAKVVGEQLVFIDGDAVQFSFVHLELNSLTSGKYYVFWKPKWESYHKCKNLVCSIYLNQESSMKRVFYKKFSESIIYSMLDMLRERMASGKDYQIPETKDDNQAE